VRTNPVAPAQRSAGARAKAAAKENQDGEEVRGFRELIEHAGHTDPQHHADHNRHASEFELLATRLPTQRRVYRLLGAPVTLKLS